MKKAIVSVSNDLSTDQRVHKVCLFLHNNGVKVTLVGRRLSDSLPLDRPYKTKRLRLLFRSGPLFYAGLNIRLFWYLFFRRGHFFVSNDLDTLLANYLITKVKRGRLIYDTHEYFTGVPELQGRKFALKTWLMIERWIFPKLKTIYTVNQSIASIYEKEYGKELKVVRNLSSKKLLPATSSRREIGLPVDKKIIIIQGAGINVDRGNEEMVEAMQFIDDAILLIIGNGDVVEDLKRLVVKLGIEQRVLFHKRMPYEELMKYTSNADLGITLDKNTNINYRFSLPNKLFDFIHAGIPVMASNLLEVKSVVEKYQVGIIIQSYDPHIIANHVIHLFNHPEKYNQLKENTKKAAEELSWENEEKVLRSIYFGN